MPDETAADMDVGERSGGGDPLVRCEFEDEELHEALAVEEDAAMAEFFEASASLLKSIMLERRRVKGVYLRKKGNEKGKGKEVEERK